MKNLALDSIRACAAFLVLAAHARQAFLVPADDVEMNPLLSAAYLLTSFGHGAVIVFFVLSGYFVGGSVIAGVRRGTFSWSRYLISRLTRLWLVLIPAVLFTAILDTIGMSLFPDSLQYGPFSFAENNGFGLALANVFFLEPNWFQPYGSNRALWSIGFEAGYYLLFPLLLIGIVRGSALRRVLFGVATAAVIVVLGPIGTILFLSWAAGAAVAWQAERIRSLLARMSRVAIVTSTTIALGALFIAMTADRLAKAEPDNIGVTTWALTLVTALLICTLLRPAERSPLVVRHAFRFGSWVSSYSYSLYATHLALLVLLEATFFGAGQSRWAPDLLGWCGVIAIIALAMAVGWAFGFATERNTDAVRAAVTRALAARRRERSSA
ncbi:acyltransferase [Microbacteriaceae bacterium VKM Ac-2855]|nr:acyltransferase [Microbacteriaceae bacterium VKM Ac-2855]